MKKYFIFIPIVIILLIGVVVSVALHVDTFEVMTIPRSYSFVSTYTDSDTMDVLVYVSTKNSYLTKKENVKNSKIISKDNYDELNVSLLDITYCDEKAEVYKHNFYLYKFSFDVTFSVTSEYELSINDAILTMDYGGRKVNLTLGSFYYYKLPYYGDSTNDLIITSLKPVLGYIGENRTTYGIKIGFRNNGRKKITLSDIKLLDPNIYASLDEVIKITESDNSYETMSSILGYNYTHRGDISKVGSLSIELDAKEEITIIVPIKYLNDYPINTFGFIVSYKEASSDEEIRYYYDDFTYFNSFKEIIDERMVVITKYENN